MAAFFWQGVDQVAATSRHVDCFADAVCYLAYARVAGSEQHSDHLRAAAATEELLAESIRCAGHYSILMWRMWLVCSVGRALVLLLAVLSASRCCTQAKTRANSCGCTTRALRALYVCVGSVV